MERIFAKVDLTGGLNGGPFVGCRLKFSYSDRGGLKFRSMSVFRKSQL